MKPPKVPCGTCPYRKDVPSGIWAPEEYAKLPPYDRQTWAQPMAVFMCHQKDGCLCGGWLMAHDRGNLLALRLARDVDPSVWDYAPDVAVFGSGLEAAEHGLRQIKRPGQDATRKIAGLLRKRNQPAQSGAQKEPRHD